MEAEFSLCCQSLAESERRVYEAAESLESLAAWENGEAADMGS